MLKNFIFDIDDTLYDQMDPFRRALTEVFPDLDQDRAPIWYKKSRYISDTEFPGLAFDPEGIKQMQIKRIQSPLADDRIDISSEEGWAFQEAYQRYQKDLDLQDDMRQVLDLLKAADQAMGVITNGETAKQWAKVETMGLTDWIPEDYILVSEEVGVAKPEREIFDLVCQRMGIRPEESVYFGDNFKHDMVAAKEAGFHTVWLNHRDREFEGVDDYVDQVCMDFPEVLAWVQKNLK
ncbi:HAD family hydrolase [Aerococcus sp. UMB1112A]|uniref:HAD family hydrolase n=1 Tax=Aerococcus sp. UMB1112A TaxID=3050609 RepID=UPI0025514C02|nr:HAD family hydrolase [Aerococcus sp. UMB1112A]MDK8502207.1 HAD family hydrolase [Aerococcus sp. UMB1112A]